MKTGLIHIYTGDGKGKTTCSVGLAVRAAGAGMRVMYRQLFKEAGSEAEPLQRLGVNCRNFPTKHPLFQKYSPEEFRIECLRCTAFVKESFELASKDNSDLLIIDELGPALASKIISTEEAAELIRKKPAKLELALTGRGFPQKIIDIADYVSEIRMVRHPFEKGVQARKGIEY